MFFGFWHKKVYGFNLEGKFAAPSKKHYSYKVALI